MHTAVWALGMEQGPHFAAEFFLDVESPLAAMAGPVKGAVLQAPQAAFLTPAVLFTSWAQVVMACRWKASCVSFLILTPYSIVSL